MKPILDSGIDYAVAKKQGLVAQPSSEYIDIGQLVHQDILGGSEKYVLSPYPDFRTKIAQEWRDEQKRNGVIIVTADMAEAIKRVANNIKNHPHSQKYIFHKDAKFEQEMFATTVEGVPLRGKGDVVIVSEENGTKSLIITDIKTTAQFDKFRKNAYWMHYDLQAVTYSLIGAMSQGVQHELVNYMFCVAETVAPYRVQFVHASVEFVEAGERKLRTCIDAITDFGDNKPNFLLEEIIELGDWSN